MKLLGLLFFVLSLSIVLPAQKVEVMSFDKLEPLLHRENDTVYVINFWATWCKPCVEELPHFMSVARDYHFQKVKFVFVSLDFPKQYKTHLIPFVEKNNYTERIILLNESNPNHYIDKVHAQWSGAIPASLFYRDGKRTFIEGSLSRDELLQNIEKYIKP